MTEEKKEDKCCITDAHKAGSSDSGCCCSRRNLIFGLLLGALIFVAGFLFAKCQHHGAAGFCPFTSSPQTK